MEALSPSSTSPSSPRRHIHSSFPYYFYSTPATPSSDRRLSAFVALCESRLTTESAPAPPSNSDNSTAAAEFAFAGFNRSVSFDDFDVAFADDIFREGRLLPVHPAVDAQPPAAASPLKPPPRLQHVAGIRKSLRMRRQRVLRGSRPAAATDDPFAVAVEKVTRDDRDAGPRWWGRRPNTCETDDDAVAAAKAKRRGIVECVKSAISAKDMKKRKNDHCVSSREEESAWLIRKPSSSNSGKLVGLARRTAVANTHYRSALLACFGFR